MGRLIIDGNSFFEIDEECLKRKNVSQRCGLEKYLKEEKTRNDLNYKVLSCKEEYIAKKK